MPDDGIYLSSDTYRNLNADLFKQDARSVVADTMEQHLSQVAPDMVAQVQQQADQQQHQQETSAQDQRNQLADQFETSVPELLNRVGGWAAPPSAAPQATPADPASPTPPDTTQATTAPVAAASAANPDLLDLTKPAPVAPNAPLVTPAPTGTVEQHPVAAVQPATPTTAALSGGGELSGRIGPQQQALLAQAGQMASDRFGSDGAKALQAVLVTEGGMAGARGDNGKSAGPLQFFEGGQLANYAQAHGLNLDQAKQAVEADPLGAIDWALGTYDKPGYLGSAIKSGLAAGLSGADLATHVQRTGQVSVSPERAGQNYQTLFGAGGQGITASAPRDPNAILEAAKPFLGQAYVWGGKSPQQGFDCSGLAGYLTTGQPESTTSLYGKSSSVGQDQAQPGDLVFWNMGSNDPHLQHVAVYLGNGQIVQSGGDQRAVNVGSIDQAIGSPPEFRRVGPGGAPAQAAAPAGAPPPNADPGVPPQQTMWDRIGTGISDVFKNVFGGGGDQPSTADYGNLGPSTAPGAASNPFAGVQSPNTGNPVADVAGTGASTVGTIVHKALSPFGGASEEFPTGGPLAGPLVGSARGVAGADQLAAEYAAKGGPQLEAQLRDLISRQNSGEKGLDDQINAVSDQLNQISNASQPFGQQVSEAAQRNPNIGGMETAAGIGQAALAAPLVAEGAPLASRAVAAAIDPQTGLPAMAGRAIEAARPAISEFATSEEGALKFPRGSSGGGEVPEDTGSILSGIARPASAAESAAVDLPRQPPALRPAVLPEGAQPITMTTQENVDRLNLSQFPDWLHQTLIDNAEATNFAENQRRGVLPTPVQQMMGEQLAQDTNVDTWIKNARAGQGLNTEQVRALKNVVATQAATVADLSQQVSKAAAAGQPADLLIAKAMAEGQRLQSLQQVLEGGRAEWGRAGQAWQAPANVMQMNPTEAVQEIFNKVGGRANALQYIQTYNDLVQQGANPIQMAKFWGGIKQPPAGFLDWFRALRVGSMAGGLPTVVHIALNAPLQAAWKLATDVPVAVGKAAIGQGDLGEIPAEMVGLWQGVRMAGDASLQMLQHGITEAQALSGDYPRSLALRSGGGALANAAETGLLGLVKTHPAMQEAAYQVGYYMEASRQAALVARSEGLKPLTSAWQSRIGDLLSNPTDQMMQAAEKTGNDFAFRGPMGTTGSAVRDFVQKTGAVGQIIMPFVGIPYHVATAGVERTPLGLLGTAVDVARQAAGRGPYAGEVSQAVTPVGRRLLNNIAGTGVFLGAYQLASQGLITDGGPSNPNQKAELLAQGWQPDSIKVGDRYVNGHILGPLFYPIGLAASAYEAGKYAKADNASPAQVFGDGLTRAVGFMGNETYLSSLGQFISAFQSGTQQGRMIERLAQGVAQSLIPQDALIRNIGQATDPNLRTPAPGDIAEGLQAGIPGHGVGPIPGREDLPLKLSPLGEPRPNPQQGLGILIPRTSVSQSEPIIQILNAAGLTAGAAPKTIPITSKYSADITPAEQQQWEGLRGQAVTYQLEPLVGDREFAQAPIATRQRILQRALQRADDVASKQLAAQIPDADLEQRVLDRLGKRAPQPIAGLP